MAAFDEDGFAFEDLGDLVIMNRVADEPDLGIA